MGAGQSRRPCEFTHFSAHGTNQYVTVLLVAGGMLVFVVSVAVIAELPSPVNSIEKVAVPPDKTRSVGVLSTKKLASAS